jgi:hypothetical protein
MTGTVDTVPHHLRVRHVAWQDKQPLARKNDRNVLPSPIGCTLVPIFIVVKTQHIESANSALALVRYYLCHTHAHIISHHGE